VTISSLAWAECRTLIERSFLFGPPYDDDTSVATITVDGNRFRLYVDDILDYTQAEVDNGFLVYWGGSGLRSRPIRDLGV
jgi:hypothetical protein